MRPRATCGRCSAQDLAAPLATRGQLPVLPGGHVRGQVGEQAGYNLGQSLLYLLVALLIGEQILAWSASYHPPGAAPRRRPLPGGLRVAGGAA